MVLRCVYAYFVCRPTDAEMSGENATEDLLGSWLSSVEYAMLDWASILVPPPVIVTGIVGNPLAAVVLLRLRAADLSAVRYAVALLAVSTLRLFAEGTMEWFAYATSTKYVMHRADWICRLWKFLLTSVKGCGAWFVIALASDRLVYVTGTPDVVTTVCSSYVSGVVLVGVVVGVLVVAMHDLWVYSLTIFGNCGVDELPAADGGGGSVEAMVWPWINVVLRGRDVVMDLAGRGSVEAMVWPWINVVLFDVLPLLAACVIVVPLAVTARRFRRSPSIVVGDGELMGMIYAALATLVIYIVGVLPTSVFRLTVYYRPPLFVASHELAAYYSALTVVSLVNSSIYRPTMPALTVVSLFKVSSSLVGQHTC